MVKDGRTDSFFFLGGFGGGTTTLPGLFRAVPNCMPSALISLMITFLRNRFRLSREKAMRDTSMLFFSGACGSVTWSPVSVMPSGTSVTWARARSTSAPTMAVPPFSTMRRTIPSRKMNHSATMTPTTMTNPMSPGQRIHFFMTGLPIPSRMPSHKYRRTCSP